MRRPGLLLALGVAVLLVAGALLPHIAVAEDVGFGRNLWRAGTYFLQVQATTAGFGAAVHLQTLATGFNVTYLGLALQQFGLVAGAVSFWVVAARDFNRWVWRIAVVAAWMTALSQPLVVLGWYLMNRAGEPALLGVAWLPTLVAGVVLVVATRRVAKHVDSDWYLARPELQ